MEKPTGGRVEIAYGYCHCGCGEKTKICKASNPARGHVKGEPFKHLAGHARGKTPVYKDIVKRFWAKVDVKGPDDCWDWQAGTTTYGYGGFKPDKGKNSVRAHRYSFELANGPIPEGMEICHVCDRPVCVNPNHLFLGTHQENMQDMMKKGRNGGQLVKGHQIENRARGEAIGISTLSEKEVLEIREKYVPGKYGYKRLAKEYKTHCTNISAIVRRVTWTHI